MAAKNNAQTSIFYSVKNGKFQTMASENEPNAIKLLTKEGKPFYVKEFNSIFSFVKGLTVSEQEYEGNKYEVVYLKLHDNTDSEIISFNIESSVSAAYIGRLSALCEDAGILNEVEICVGSDKESSGSFGYIRQKGITVKSIFNQNNPLPKWKEIKINGKKSLWDRSEQTEILKQHIDKINKCLGVEATTETKNPLTGVDDTQGLQAVYYTKKGSPLTYDEAKIAHENGQPLYDSSKNIVQFDDLPF